MCSLQQDGHTEKCGRLGNAGDKPCGLQCVPVVGVLRVRHTRFGCIVKFTTLSQAILDALLITFAIDSRMVTRARRSGTSFRPRSVSCVVACTAMRYCITCGQVDRPLILARCAVQYFLGSLGRLGWRQERWRHWRGASQWDSQPIV
jgi:hypothetical protein